MPKITIFRGLPGSGKTTAARRLQALTGAIMLEPDMLCVRDGVYLYNEVDYEDAKKHIKLMLTYVLYKPCDLILADVFQNTMKLVEITAFHLRKYQTLDYSLELVEMPTLTLDESLARNKHHVCREDIERMIAEYQPLDEVCDNLSSFFLNVEGVKLSNNADIENYFGELEKEVKK